MLQEFFQSSSLLHNFVKSLVVFFNSFLNKLSLEEKNCVEGEERRGIVRRSNHDYIPHKFNGNKLVKY